MWFKNRNKGKSVERADAAPRQAQEESLKEKAKSWGALEENGNYMWDCYIAPHLPGTTTAIIQSIEQETETADQVFMALHFKRLHLRPEFPGFIERGMRVACLARAEEFNLIDGLGSWCCTQSLVYEFKYPMTLSIRARSVADTKRSKPFGMKSDAAYLLLGGISKCDAERRRRIGETVAKGAQTYEELFDLAFLLSIEYDWMECLERDLRAFDRFLDVTKILLYKKHLEALTDWFQQHARMSEYVLALEKVMRFGDALRILEQLGPEGYCDVFDERTGDPKRLAMPKRQERFEAKRSVLRAAAASMPSAKQ